jgi:hypothetical protein
VHPTLYVLLYFLPAPLPPIRQPEHRCTLLCTFCSTFLPAPLPPIKQPEHRCTLLCTFCSTFLPAPLPPIRQPEHRCTLLCTCCSTFCLHSTKRVSDSDALPRHVASALTADGSVSDFRKKSPSPFILHPARQDDRALGHASSRQRRALARLQLCLRLFEHVLLTHMLVARWLGRRASGSRSSSAATPRLSQGELCACGRSLEVLAGGGYRWV